MEKVLIIIPCFNEEQNIVSLLKKLNDIHIEGIELNILPINDGSKDNTLNFIKNHSLKYLNLENNLGIGGAVQCGIKYAQRYDYDYAAQMDGDGQHPPEELEKLIKHLKNNDLDLCIGSRYINPIGFQSSKIRRFGISILNKIIKICTSQKIYDCTSGFRVMNKRTINLFVQYYPDKYPEPESIVIAHFDKLKIGEVQVEMKERHGGISSISGVYTLYYMVKVSLSILFLKIGFLLKK